MIKLLSSTTAVAAFLIVAFVSQSTAKGFCGLLEGDKYNGSGTHVNGCPKMGEYRRYHVTSPVRYRPGCDGHRPGESWLTYLDPARHHAVRHSLLVLPGKTGDRKTRVAVPWLEACGWRTQLIERRHLGDIALTDADPPYLLSGLDRLEPRLTLARHGFPYMLDAGIGRGPVDFEGIQVRTIVGGKPLDGLWGEPNRVAGEAGTKELLDRPAYVELERHIGQCGTVGFAEASVAVPFVGAATGALTIAQAVRLASMEPAPHFLQMELGAPEMTTFGGLIAATESNLGSLSVRLLAAAEA
jgi:hypothetical protein